MYQTIINPDGSARIDVNPNNTAVEWVIRQASVNTNTINLNCMAALYFNDAYLHSTPLGSLDSATGPPYPIVGAGDIFTATWGQGTAGDQANLTILYDEVPAGTGYGGG